MSMTDSEQNVAICNKSLGLLGAAEITYLATTEQNHIYCTTFFDDARDEILVAHRWNFAKKRMYAIQTTDPLFGYDNAFTKPSDALKILQIEQIPDAVFEVENALILTDEGSIPQSWATSTIYKANEYVSVTPSAWATGAEYIDGQYVTDSDLVYEVLTDHTSGTLATDVTNSKIISRGAGTKGTYLIATAHTSSTLAVDIAASNLTPANGDSDILKVEYIYQHKTFSTWPVYAQQCLVINLARMLVSAIKQDTKVAVDLQAMLYGSKKVTGYLDIARSLDAQEGGAVTIKTNTWLRSRRSGRGLNV